MSTQHSDWTPDLDRKFIKLDADTEDLFTAIAACQAIGAGRALVDFQEDALRFEAINKARTGMATATVDGVDYQTGWEPVSVGIDPDGFCDSIPSQNDVERQTLQLSSDPAHADEAMAITAGNLLSYGEIYDPESVRRRDERTDLGRDVEITTDTTYLKAATGAVSRGQNSSYRVGTTDGEMWVAGAHTWTSSERESFEADVTGGDTVSAFAADLFRPAVDALPPATEVTIDLDHGSPIRMQTDQLSITLAPVPTEVPEADD